VLGGACGGGRELPTRVFRMTEMNRVGWPRPVVAALDGARRRAERVGYAFHASNGSLR
jgi:hypothetical protein